MDEMTSDYEAQRFALMQAVSEQVILPSQLKALCPNKMMSDRHGQLPILGLTSNNQYLVNSTKGFRFFRIIKP